MADDPIKPDNQPQNTPPPNQDALPEKFRGKSAEEIAASYAELEKKHTQLSQDHSLTKKERDDLKALESFIDNDPDSFKYLQSRIEARKSGKTTPETPAQPQNDPRVSRLEAELNDTRLSTQSGIFEKFEGKYGLREETDDTKEIKTRIGNTIKQMVAPKSPKTPAEIIATLPLDVLPQYLENAYKLATADDEKERVRRKTIAQTRMNQDATFSDSPSTSLRENTTSLTAEEKKVARGLGITEEKYLSQKKSLNEEYAG